MQNLVEMTLALAAAGKKYKKCCSKLETALPLRPEQQNFAASALGQNEINQLIELFNSGSHEVLERRAFRQTGGRGKTELVWGRIRHGQRLFVFYGLQVV